MFRGALRILAFSKRSLSDPLICRVCLASNPSTALFSSAAASAHPEQDIFHPPAPLLAGAHVSGLPSYLDLYKESIHNSDAFWAAIAAELHFEKGSTKGIEYNFDPRKGRVFTRFMADSKTNMAYNCLERNIEKGYGDRVAFHCEGNHPADTTSITYRELQQQVNAFSSVLRARGVKKGDVVAICLPMVAELAVAMLACARIGAVHSVIFAGFSAEALAARITDAKCRVLVTADGFYRGTKVVHLKPIVDRAAEIAEAEDCPLEKTIILEHLKRSTPPGEGAEQKGIDGVCTHPRDELWATAMESASDAESAVEWMDAEDNLFVLFTSGSAGKPKGIVHTTAGYMTYAYQTCKMTFDAHPKDDVYWCTADCGWITGHTYLLYGPLLNGLTGVLYEGVPTFPDAGRMWQITEKYKVNKMYTSPTAARVLMALGDEWVKKYDRSSLQIIGTVGEPICPSTWKWLHNVVGDGKAAILDTYWQTETGGHVIAPLPGATPLKPSSATLPTFGVEAVLLDHDGKVVDGPGEGTLCFARAWPGMLRGIWGDEERYEQTYFSPYPGFYFTGDGAKRDKDGYIWVTGRVDDLMNVSGHLLSTTEIERALQANPKVAEAAVVPAPHDLKGSYPYAFVTLNQGVLLTEELIADLKAGCREKIGAIAVPDIIQEAPALPKTRSGKVTRRILRKIAENKFNDFGDTSTLIDESVIEHLINARKNIQA